MVSEMRLINNNKCLSKLICLQNIVHTSVMNDVSTFYLDKGVLSYPCKKVREFCPGGGGVVRGGFVRGFLLRGFCPTFLCIYIEKKSVTFFFMSLN